MKHGRWILAAGLLLAAACDLTGTDGEPARLALALDFETAPAAVERILVRITAPDIVDDIWVELEISGDHASGHIECPAGADRLVEVDVYEEGVIAYTASGTVAELAPGETATLQLTAAGVLDDYLQVTGRLGSYGCYDYQFDMPVDLVFDDTGDLFVVDPAGATLTAYDPDGIILWRTDLAALAGELGLDAYTPATLTPLPAADELWLADPLNGRLDRFSATDGSYLAQLAVPDTLTEPADMATLSDGTVFVLDGDGSELYHLDADGGALDGPWTLLDDNDQALENPAGLGLGAPGDGYESFGVSDSSAGRVYAYIYTDGVLLFNFATAEGLLAQPLGIASLGTFGCICDGTLHRLVLIDTNGNFLENYGEAGDRLGTFTAPAGAAVAPDGALWIADTGNHRLQRFAPLR